MLPLVATHSSIESLLIFPYEVRVDPGQSGHPKYTSKKISTPPGFENGSPGSKASILQIAYGYSTQRRLIPWRSAVEYLDYLGTRRSHLRKIITRVTLDTMVTDGNMVCVPRWYLLLLSWGTSYLNWARIAVTKLELLLQFLPSEQIAAHICIAKYSHSQYCNHLENICEIFFQCLQFATVCTDTYLPELFQV